jgi:hypothetical protein
MVPGQISIILEPTKSSKSHISQVTWVMNKVKTFIVNSNFPMKTMKSNRRKDPCKAHLSLTLYRTRLCAVRQRLGEGSGHETE